MSELAVTIREACPTDAERVAALLYELGYPGTVVFAREKLRALAASDSDSVFVAEVEGCVVGVAHLHVAELFQRAARTGRVMALVVDEAFRGRGVGRALMEAAEKRAAELGCCQVEASSGFRREGAHAFYRRLGYAERRRHFTKPIEAEDK
jgi:GNAT superfamily N-acetyltransferase